jgi:hypothetical protein
MKKQQDRISTRLTSQQRADIEEKIKNGELIPDDLEKLSKNKRGKERSCKSSRSLC